MTTAMATAPRTKGPGKYKILRGTHSEGQRVCSCGKHVYRADFAEHEKQGHSVASGTPVIYGARNKLTGNYPHGVNGGEVIDSRFDLSRLNTGPDKKFAWVSKGTYSVKSQEEDTLEKMSKEELIKFAEDLEIPLGDDLPRDDILVSIRQAMANS